MLSGERHCPSSTDLSDTLIEPSRVVAAQLWTRSGIPLDAGLSLSDFDHFCLELGVLLEPLVWLKFYSIMLKRKAVF